MNGPQESILHVYIDETGDRGTSAVSSQWFALVAVLVPHEHDWMARTFISGFRQEVVKTNRALHWTEHLRPKRLDRRDRMMELMTLLPVTVIVVATHKRCLRAGAGSITDGATFYNYAYRLLLERVAYAARDWSDGPRRAQVRADSVKGMNHGETLDYLEMVRDGGRKFSKYPVPWDKVSWPPTWHDSSGYDGLQLADMYSGSLGTAMRGESDQWLARWIHQIRGAGTADVWRRGFKLTTDCHGSCLVPHHSWAGRLSRPAGEHRLSP